MVENVAELLLVATVDSCLDIRDQDLEYLDFSKIGSSKILLFSGWVVTTQVEAPCKDRLTITRVHCSVNHENSRE